MAKPKLRFPKYQEEWASYPFGDFLTEVKDKSKTENETTLLSSAIEGMFLNSELFGHQRGSSNIGYKKIKKGMLVLSAQNLHLGNANVNLRFEEGMVSPAYNTYTIQNCDIEFMSHWIKRPATNRFFYNATTVGASVCRRNVDWKMLMSSKVAFPKMEEQKEIANFLNQINARISEQEEIIKNLEAQKSGLMKQLFTQEVRFQNTDGTSYPDWEETKLSDICDFLQGLTYSPSDVTDDGSGTLVLRSSNVQNQKIVYDDNVFVRADIPNKLKVHKDDILMCVRNGSQRLVGKTAIITENDLGHSWGAFMMILRSKLNNHFLYHYFNSTLFYNFIFKDISTATINQITKGKLNECTLELPCEEEQQRITNALSLFDDKIEIERRILDDYLLLKKGIVQKMFV